jgi:SNF2 family DNA or RNA helicase
MFEKFASIGCRYFNKRGVKAGVYTGTLTSKQKTSSLADFQQGDVQVLFITIKTGGEGLNLVEADCAVFADLPWHKTAIDHAEARICRIGQKKPVVDIVTVKSVNTVEDWIMQLIQEKGKVSLNELIERMGKR